MRGVATKKNCLGGHFYKNVVTGGGKKSSRWPVPLNELNG